MAGTRLRTSSSSAALSVFSTRDDSGVIRALIGRHEECTPLVITAGCTNGLVSRPAQPLQLALENSDRVRAVVTEVPADGGVLTAPVPVLDSILSPVGGTTTVPIPAVADGAAYIVTLVPVGDPIIDPGLIRTTSAVVDSNGRLTTFHRSADGALWSRTGWASTLLGGQIVGAPDAASSGDGRIAVVARGIDDRVWARTYAGGNWGDWFTLGGNTIGSPSIVGRPDGHVDVFVTDAAHVLWQRSSDGTKWSPWKSMGGDLTSAPDAAALDGSRLVVVGRGHEGEVRLSVFDGMKWSVWWSLGGRTVGSPMVKSLGSGQLNVIARGTDDRLWSRTWTGSSWRAWTTTSSR
jgi:hypothetical protein